MLNRRYYIALGIVVVVTLVLLKLPGKAANQLKLAIGGLFLPASGLTVSGRELTKKAANAFDLIVNDPLGFLKNVLGALKEGFVNFFKNIATHLLTGVADWLFGELIEKVYEGSAMTLVLQALSSSQATKEERDEIRRLLDQMEGKSP